jgi:hypothetical protein
MLYQHPYLDVYFVFYTYVHDNLWKSAALGEFVSQDIGWWTIMYSNIKYIMQN